jgi:hypothetical protein
LTKTAIIEAQLAWRSAKRILRKYVMKNFSVFGSALALAVALGAFPLMSANADQASEDAAKAAYEDAKASCDAMSDAAAKAECMTQAEADMKAAMEAAAKK